MRLERKSKVMMGRADLEHGEKRFPTFVDLYSARQHLWELAATRYAIAMLPVKPLGDGQAGQTGQGGDRKLGRLFAPSGCLPFRVDRTVGNGLHSFVSVSEPSR